MNRQQMRTRLQQMLGELVWTPQNDAPFTLDDDLSYAVSDLARASYCFFGREQTDIQTNVEEYCAPNKIFRITSVTATWADGSTAILRDDLSEWASDNYEAGYAGNWRTAPVSGNPLAYIPLGLNRVKLYPVPNYTSVIANYTDLVIQAPGNVVSSVARPFVAATDYNALPAPPRVLLISGGNGFTPGWYNVTAVSGGQATLDRACGTVAATGGVGALSQGGLIIHGFSDILGSMWPNDTDECPLPTRAHETAIYGAAIKRIIEFPTQENGARLKMIEGRYNEGRAKLVREAHTQARAMREHGAGRYAQYPYL